MTDDPDDTDNRAAALAWGIFTGVVIGGFLYLVWWIVEVML